MRVPPRVNVYVRVCFSECVRARARVCVRARFVFTAVVVTSHLTGAYGWNGYLLRFRIDKNSKQNTFKYLARTNSRVIFLTLCLGFHRFMSHSYRSINESNIRYHSVSIRFRFHYSISDFLHRFLFAFFITKRLILTRLCSVLWVSEHNISQLFFFLNFYPKQRMQCYGSMCESRIYSYLLASLWLQTK